MSLIRATSSVQTTGPGATYDGPAVYVNWHRHVPFLLAHHGARQRWILVGRAPYLAPMIRWCRLHGLRTVPVGSDARRVLTDALARGESVMVAVDGPNGPAFEPKQGCVELARQARVPIIPVAYTSRRSITLSGRWDRALVPTLFDRIEVRVGAPLSIEEGMLPAEALERVAAGLNELRP